MGRLTLLVVLALAPAVSRADEALEEPGRLAAVQKRRFHLGGEIFAAASLLPLDAFYKGVGPSGAFTLHFSDTWAWEVVRGGYSFALQTSLRDQLQKDFGVSPTSFEQLQLLVGSAAVFKPLYGKLALLNRSVVHGEVYALLGGTVARYSDSWKPGPQAGLGARVFLSPSVSLRAEARYHVLFGGQRIDQVLELASGLALSFGGDD